MQLSSPHQCLCSLFNPEWPEFVSSYAPWWASHALSWLKFGRRLFVVHYEELQRSLLPQLRLITSFLNVTMTEERLLCAQSNQDGHFKRSGSQQSSFDPFTPDMRRMIDSFIHTVDQALQKRNFSGLPQDYLPRWWYEKVLTHSALNEWARRSWDLCQSTHSALWRAVQTRHGHIWRMLAGFIDDHLWTLAVIGPPDSLISSTHCEWL